jgi:hypothetical protein
MTPIKATWKGIPMRPFSLPDVLMRDKPLINNLSQQQETNMTTTITRLKQLRDWLDGKLKEERVKRKAQPFKETPVDFSAALTNTKPPSVLYTVFENIKIDRFSSYREKIIPKLRDYGYGYFLSCDSNEYVEHQKWCDQYCTESTLPHCDVWQIDTKYPRAFASKADAAMFKITFDAANIE